MAFAPDGRLFVCEQGGGLRVVKNGALLATPFVTLSVDSRGERGLLGVAFDPNFAVNQFVYVYYTATTPVIHNRVSRFTASGDVALPGSETVILELDPLSATNHNGGAIHFGADGKLYVAVGDNAVGSNAQTLANRHGKMLRIDPSGSIPADNPFHGSAFGANRAIWALGLRNPFSFAVQPGTGRLFINDVGQNTWEEINDGIAGSNYGWPATEGPTSNPAFRGPLHAYNHADGGCAITGGAFYNPPTVQFPGDHVGDYFFPDLCGGWIRRFDPATGAVTGFATGIGAPVDVKVASDGSLYYLSIATGAVYRVRFTAFFDFDGDGRTDIGVYRGTTGEWLLRHSATGALSVIAWGAPVLDDKPVPDDYDGDGQADLAVYRRTTGEWLIRRSTDAGLTRIAWGSPPLDDVPVPGDYDGDGRTDLAVYRRTRGEWLVRRSTDGGLTHIAWGSPPLGDVPVPGDYDGDGRTDLAVYRRTTGEWLIRRSTDGGLTHLAWGSPFLDDTPVPGDYDGDGRTDLAVYRRTRGEWLIRRSTDGGLAQIAWGAPLLDDVPVAGDYDGDGKGDIAVYRRSRGEWYLRSSADAGLTHHRWGAPILQDVPARP
jgi:glucose/arabinose dehydrogenase